MNDQFELIAQRQFAQSVHHTLEGLWVLQSAGIDDLHAFSRVLRSRQDKLTVAPSRSAALRLCSRASCSGKSASTIPAPSSTCTPSTPSRNQPRAAEPAPRR